MNDNQQLLDVLTREGVLVAVNVRYWRARAGHPLVDTFTARACAVAARSALH